MTARRSRPILLPDYTIPFPAWLQLAVPMRRLDDCFWRPNDFRS